MKLGPARAVLAIIVGATALRLGLAAITDLGLDEAYALAVGRHFQLSWFDHPPLTFWIVGALHAGFGSDVPPLVLRLPFIALAALTTWLLFRLTARHFGERAGLWAAFLFTLAPFFLLSAGSWVVPDGPLCFFLVLAALGLSRVVLDPDAEAYWRDWLLVGVALGLALLSKYHAVLFAAGAVIYFAAHPRLRMWFIRPEPYVAVLVAALLFSPVLVWNAGNEWASFAFQLGRSQPGGSSFEIAARLFLTEAAYLLPTTALLLLATLAWAVAARAGRSTSTAFFLALALPLIIVVDLPRLWTWQSYAHWAMPGWMFLFPPLGALLVHYEGRWHPTGPLVAGLSLLQFAAMVVAVVLLLSDFRVRDPGMESFRVEAGRWTGVAEGIAAAAAAEPPAFIVTRRWSDAARVSEATRTPLPVFVFDVDPRGFAWSAGQRQLIGEDALIVAHAGELPALIEMYRDHFERIEPIGTYPIEPGNPHSMEVARAIGLKQPWPHPYGLR